MSAVTLLGAPSLTQAMEEAIGSLATCSVVKQLDSDVSSTSLLCPLTLDVSPTWEFWGQKIFAVCGQVNALRQEVSDRLGCVVGDGDYWLPIVHTAKGPLYGEVIAELLTGGYQQPWHLDDRLRQPLYQMGFWLLQELQAPPAVYLMGFGYREDGALMFDRLLPYPAEPALASRSVQQPDLFTCHWRCLNHQPILDLLIPGDVPHQIKS